MYRDFRHAPTIVIRQSSIPEPRLGLLRCGFGKKEKGYQLNDECQDIEDPKVPGHRLP